ncbi:MAG: hypothetical protein V7767_01310 [Leeuwenhoekiella sp.]
MASKFDMRKLEKKYKNALENAYNLKYTAPSESDYFSFKAKKLYTKILLLDSVKHQSTMRAIA